MVAKSGNSTNASRIELICVCVCVCENVTLHPASSLSRHDGRRSFVWLLIVVVAEPMEPATTFAWYNALVGGDVGVVGNDPVFLSTIDCWSLLVARFKASLFVPKCSRPAFSSEAEYLLASLRNLSANDNELALSMSSSDRF